MKQIHEYRPYDLKNVRHNGVLMAMAFAKRTFFWFNKEVLLIIVYDIGQYYVHYNTPMARFAFHVIMPPLGRPDRRDTEPEGLESSCGVST